MPFAPPAIPYDGTVRVAIRRMMRLFIGWALGSALPGCESSSHPCSTSLDCSANQICGYAIDAGCTAHGTCQDKSVGAQCGGGTIYCGCDGSGVPVSCGDPGDYAPAPVSFAGSCPIPLHDASVE